MDLPTYIRERGVGPCAEQFGVSVHTINSWLYKARKPRPLKAMEIEAATKGYVTIREIFEQEPA